MKFLVLGSNGMAGHMIGLYLKEKGHDIRGFARRDSKYLDTIIGDVRDLSLLKHIILESGYDAIINCVGLLIDASENNKADAVFINSFVPNWLADVTNETGTKVIQISTDCVFSGRRGGVLRV